MEDGRERGMFNKCSCVAFLFFHLPSGDIKDCGSGWEIRGNHCCKMYFDRAPSGNQWSLGDDA